MYSWEVFVDSFDCIIMGMRGCNYKLVVIVPTGYSNSEITRLNMLQSSSWWQLEFSVKTSVKLFLRSSCIGNGNLPFFMQEEATESSENGWNVAVTLLCHRLYLGLQLFYTLCRNLIKKKGVGTYHVVGTWYRKRRNIGSTLNLAVWRLAGKPPNLMYRQYYCKHAVRGIL